MMNGRSDVNNQTVCMMEQVTCPKVSKSTGEHRSGVCVTVSTYYLHLLTVTYRNYSCLQ